MAVDLDDMRPANWLLEAIDCDVEVQLHLPSTKSLSHYLVDSQTLIPMSEMRNVMWIRNKTTWSNADKA